MIIDSDIRLGFISGKLRYLMVPQPATESSIFLPFFSGISAEHLNFSRDGEWVAYIAYPEATLWRSKLDGSQRLQLSFPPLRAILPHWSPQGKQIAFIGWVHGKTMKMYTVSAEGGTPQQLLPGEPGEVDPDWSPDGNSLIFARGDPFSVSEASGALEPVAIHLLDLKSHQVSTLPGSQRLFAPVWSPQGRYVAALGEGAQKLLLFDFTTKKWVELASIFTNYVSWSRDGRYIYFDSQFGSDPAIYRVSISDRKLERVVSLKNIRRERGTWTHWFGLAPDDSPLLLRSVGTQEIYALEWEAP